MTNGTDTKSLYKQVYGAKDTSTPVKNGRVDSKRLYEQLYGDASKVTQPAEQDFGITSFDEGLEAGAKTLKAGGSYALGEIANYLGADKLGEGLQTSAREIQQSAPQDDDSWGFFLGSLVPSAAPSAAAIGLAPFTGGGSLLAAGSIGALSFSSAGNGMMEYEQYKQDQGQEVDPLTKVMVGGAYGAAEGLMERFQLGKLMPSGFAGKILKGNVEAAEQAGQDLLQRFAGRHPKRYQELLKKTRAGVGTESLEEVATELAQFGTQYLYQEDEGRKELVRQLPTTLYKAALGGGIMGGALGPLSYASQNKVHNDRRKANGSVYLAENTEDNQVYELIAPVKSETQDGYRALSPDGQETFLPRERMGEVVDMTPQQFQQLLRDRLDTREYETAQKTADKKPIALGTYQDTDVKILGQDSQGDYYIEWEGGQKLVPSEQIENIQQFSPREQVQAEQAGRPGTIQDPETGEFITPDDAGYEQVLQKAEGRQPDSVVVVGSGDKKRGVQFKKEPDGSFTVMGVESQTEEGPVVTPVESMNATEVNSLMNDLTNELGAKGEFIIDAFPIDGTDPSSPMAVFVVPKDSEKGQQIFERQQMDQYEVQAQGSELNIVNPQGEPVGRQSKYYFPKVKEYFEQTRDTYSEMPRVTDSGDVTEQNYVDRVASESENPIELAEAYLEAVDRTQNEQAGNLRDIFIAQDLAESRIPSSDLEKRGLDNQIYYAQYASRRADVDLAMRSEYLSDQLGVDLTEDDILDFIKNNPGGPQAALNQKPEILTRLEERFEEVTGVPLQKGLAESIAGTEQTEIVRPEANTEADFDENIENPYAEVENELKNEGVPDEEIEQIKQQSGEIDEQDLAGVESAVENAADEEQTLEELDDFFSQMGREFVESRRARPAGVDETEAQPVAQEVPGVSEETEAAESGTEVEETPKASTQLNIEGEAAERAVAFAESIPESDLYTDEEGFGRETEPHVTLFYGLTDNDPEAVQKLLAGAGPIEITFGQTSLFQNDDYDVLKVDVESPLLRELHNRVKENLPNETTFPDYNPHMTIAYLKPGEGAKYTGDTRFEGQTATFTELLHSGFDREKTPISLTSEEQPPALDQRAQRARERLDDILTGGEPGPLEDDEILGEQGKNNDIVEEPERGYVQDEEKETFTVSETGQQIGFVSEARKLRNQQGDLFADRGRGEVQPRPETDEDSQQQQQRELTPTWWHKKRVWTPSKQWTLYGDTSKIESPHDVAYLFRQLETEAVEHVFALYIDEAGNAYPQHISSGGATASIVDTAPIMAGVNRFKAKRMVFVHNHPGGMMRPSAADRSLLDKINSIVGEDVEVDGVIIDTYTGEFLSFLPEKKGGGSQLLSRRGLQATEERFEVQTFNKVVFNSDVDEDLLRLSRKNINASHVARFFTALKHSVGDKRQVFIADNGLNITAVYAIPETNLADIGRFIDDVTIKHGGRQVILVGRGFGDSALGKIKNYTNVGIADVIHVDTSSENAGNYRSLRDSGGFLGTQGSVMEPGPFDDSRRNLTDILEGDTDPNDPDIRQSINDQSLGENYGRVIPRDFFNESKLIGMYSRFADFYNKGKLPEGFEIVRNSDDFGAGLSEEGDMYSDGVEIYYNGEPATLTMTYNAGKDDRFPLQITVEPEDIWSVTVFDDNGELDSEFIEAFGEPSGAENNSDVTEIFTEEADFLKQMGVVGLWHVDGLLPREFEFDVIDFHSGFQVEEGDKGLQATNVSAEYQGEKVDFYIPNGESELHFDYGEQTGKVISGARDMSDEFKNAFLNDPDIRRTIADLPETASSLEFHRARIRDEINAVTNQWASDDFVNVVDNVEDLPAPIHRNIVRRNQQRRTSGVFTNHSVYVIADNLRDADHAKRVLSHEAFGHLGLRSLVARDASNQRDFEGRLEQLLGEVHDSFKDTDKYQEIVNRYRLDLRRKRDRMEAAEEYIANAAEGDLTPTLWEKIVKFVNEVMNRLGLGKDWTQADIKKLLQDSKMLVRGDRYAHILGDGSHLRTAFFSFNGGPEIARPTNSEAFKEWFGDSKVVDEDGEPMVVYHGSPTRNIRAFNTNADNQFGVHFAVNSDMANEFLQDSGQLYPAYLAIQNPYDIVSDLGDWADMEMLQEYLGEANDGPFSDDQFSEFETPQDVRDALQALRYDGIKYQNSFEGNTDTEMGSVNQDVYIVFEPAQIKSATGNRGTFDSNNSDIRFSLNDLDESSFSYQRRFDGLVRKFQDRAIAMKRYQQGIEAGGGVVTDVSNVHQEENLARGRRVEQIRRFEERHKKPVLELMQQGNEEFGINYRDYKNYLYARHAAEANADLAERNPEGGDAQSGMSNSEAEQALAKFENQGWMNHLQRFGDRVDAIIEENLKAQLAYGLITPFQYAQYRDQFQHYVPLRGWEDWEETDPTLYVGPERRAGRSSRAGDILAYTFGMYETTMLRGEKNLVKQKFLRLAQDNYDRTDLFRIKNVYWKRLGEKDESGKDKYRAVFEKPTAEQLLSGEVVQTLDRNVMKGTWEERDPHQDPNIRVMVKGRPVVVEVKDPHVSDWLNGLDLDETSIAAEKLNKYMSFLRNAYINYSPEFTPRNFFRDGFMAAFNLGTDFDANTMAAIISPRRLNKTRRAVWQALKHDNFDTEMGASFEKYLTKGTMSGYFQLAPLKKVSKNLKDYVDKHDNPWVRTKEFGKLVDGYMSAYTSTAENMIRFSTFDYLINNGVINPKTSKAYTNKQAAAYAKNLTVNFDRKGAYGHTIGSLWLFYNATVQGIARQFEPFTHGNAKRRKVRAAAASVIMGGMGYAATELLRYGLGTDDDDEDFVDKINDFTIAHRFMVPNFFSDKPGDMISIPLPYGLNNYWAAGVYANKIMAGSMAPEEAAFLIGSNAWQSFNPIGGEASARGPVYSGLKTLLPEILVPPFEYVTNENFAGRPIRPEPFPYGPQAPKSQKYWQYTSEWAKHIASALNTATGGDEYESGVIDISPNDIEFFISSYTGGAGNFILSTIETGENLGKAALTEDTFTGEDARRVPMVRVFFSQVPNSASRSTFFNNRTRLEYMEWKHEQLLKKEGNEQAVQYWRENQKIMNLVPLMDATKKQVDRAYDRLDLLDKREAPDGEKEEVLKYIKQMYDRFNKQYNEATGRASSQNRSLSARLTDILEE